MNGKSLPYDSREMKGIMSYIWWLSYSVPTGIPVEGRGLRAIGAVTGPDVAKGKDVYANNCAACHGENGGGIDGDGGEYLFPVLWGQKSFNKGAGMNNLNTAASFIKSNMPRGNPTLTDQEAYDVAAYILSMPRPDYPEMKKDWPPGR